MVRLPKNAPTWLRNSLKEIEKQMGNMEEVCWDKGCKCSALKAGEALAMIVDTTKIKSKKQKK
ncbi:MAG: hypothetical protein HY746_09715 [Elusimicrobia bacterium]|nr:hypothetical protein [Elusimicrobiota bacterium]